MANCYFVLEPAGEQVRCTRCGRSLPTTRLDLQRTCTLPGLGDQVAQLLHRVGIQPWEGCGCSERQERLNRLEGRVRGFWP